MDIRSQSPSALILEEVGRMFTPEGPEIQRPMLLAKAQELGRKIWSDRPLPHTGAGVTTGRSLAVSLSQAPGSAQVQVLGNLRSIRNYPQKR